MKVIGFLCLSVAVFGFIPVAAEPDGGVRGQAEVGIADPLDAYNVVWDSPSQDHNGSMPIGNGDIGMNVWMEPNGDLLLLLSKTDAWSEDAELLKLGRVRVSFSPNPLDRGAPFKQTLRLRQGDISILAGEAGKAVALMVWVDANRPVIRVEAQSLSPFEMKVMLEVWRRGQKILENPKNRIVWHERDESSIWRNNLEFQGLGYFIAESADPLLRRTFGGCIEGTDLASENAATLKSKASHKSFVLSIHPLCAQTETADAWERSLDRSVADDHAVNLDESRALHRKWWDEFWNRSWIRITGSPEVVTLSRAYALQRWINACGGRGKAAIKFNGSIFTVDGEDGNPDGRRWGGAYWWQNTRLPYWPMLACGDYDLMMPLFRMYRDMIPLEENRTKTWFDHGGAFIGEVVHFWGMYRNGDYGIPYIERRDQNLPVGELMGKWSGFIRREYTASPGLMALMLDYYEHTRDEDFLRETLLPTCDALLAFWNKHYKTDDAGRMIMYPAQVLETYWDARNPTPDVAGLQWVLGKLLEIPEEKTGARRREFWQKLSAEVPPLPMGEENGRQCILPAAWTDEKMHNGENGELYAVFPFRLYGVGKPHLDVARFTFTRRKATGNVGWVQVGVQAAYLGLTDTAVQDVVSRAQNKDEKSRFPAFWVLHADWVPNQCHGGNMMMALQTMLMQADDGNILLLPAWPDNWDVDFKLHAPEKTVVEGTVKNGKLVRLTTDPASRQEDVVVMENGAAK